MSPSALRPLSAAGVGHPAVRSRRLRDVTAIGLAGAISSLAALGIIVATPDASVANIVLVLAAIIGVVGVVALAASSRLEVTVTMLTLFLLLILGPVKLGLGGGELSHGVDDVLIAAISLGALMRLVVRRQPLKLPPLSGWVLAFAATVALEAFNPDTGGMLKVLGGFRQQLQFVPFFFFGYVLIRSKRRFRQLFLLVGVCALANGVVASYQTTLSPAQLARWGPGYRLLFQPSSLGKNPAGARTYSSEGEARARPLGLGPDSGFSGGVGLIALPFCLALLATWRSRRRWVAAVLALGAMAGVVTGLGRLQVVGAVIALIAFAALARVGGRRFGRAFVAVLTVAALAVPLGVAFISVLPSGTFTRYRSFEKDSPTQLATHKSAAWTKIPHFIARAPFGIGLGTVGSVGRFGGLSTLQEEGRGAGSETQYNFIVDELGAPGLLVYIALLVSMVTLVVRGLRRVRDSELATMLAGLFAPFIALIFMGFSGPLSTSDALGPYFWFAIGVVAYWLAGPGRARAAQTPARPLARSAAVVA